MAGGHTEPNEGDHQYSYGTVVNINVILDLHYHFINWTGTGVTADKVANPNLANTTITMDGDYTLTASFAIDTFYPQLHRRVGRKPDRRDRLRWLTTVPMERAE